MDADNAIITLAGSSPLARGTHPLANELGDQRRFIPARAGNTPPSRPPTRPSAVHPRSRGEHTDEDAKTYRGNGSSPLARGTPPTPASPPAGDRFIPARAGNTAGRRRWRRRGTVHPRSRGEHMGSARPAEAMAGSSPLARGTRGRHGRPGRDRRFIPARAGNTTAPSRTPWRPSVHPRSRGEHALYGGHRSRYHGSSPLARGTLHVPRNSVLFHRFIPARAGNTCSRQM